MPPPTTVRVDGVTIREMRVASGYDLHAFALLTGISRPYLSLIETGHRHNVSPSIFARICALLGVAEDPGSLQADPAESTESVA
jgi:transcriptional regulator with XRE-family HTH domain